MDALTDTDALILIKSIRYGRAKLFNTYSYSASKVMAAEACSCVEEAHIVLAELDAVVATHTALHKSAKDLAMYILLKTTDEHVMAEYADVQNYVQEVQQVIEFATHCRTAGTAVTSRRFLGIRKR